MAQRKLNKLSNLCQLLRATANVIVADFVKLAESFGAVGIRAEMPDELDGAIMEMIASDKPVIFDCRVAKLENCYPMVPSGAGHHEMILADAEDHEEFSGGAALV